MKDLIRRIIREQSREMSPEMMTVYKLLERKIGYDNEFSTQYPLPYADRGNVYLKFNYGLNDRTKPKRDEDGNLYFITYIDVRNPIWKSDFDQDWEPVRDLREIDPILSRLRQEIYKEIYRFLPEGSVIIQWKKVEDKKVEEQTLRTQEVMGVVNEGLHDTSWENEKGDKITLIDLLKATEEIPVQKISVEELKPYLLSWDDNPKEIKKIKKANLQYPILIFVTSNGEFLSIIDGHHRAQKAARKGLETIKAKVINIDTLPKKIRKVFSHLRNQKEMTEGEITERCWKGYTQKGMKTMFGKRYPNCVKKTK